jgi:Peptide-N-glycosidase F, N terminal/Peptide-N-glycosidase F, C terminal/N-glycanase peptide, N-terminal domain
MHRIFSIVIFCFPFIFPTALNASNYKDGTKATQLVYHHKNNGKVMDGKLTTLLFQNGLCAFVQTDTNSTNFRFIEYTGGNTIEILSNEGQQYKLIQSFEEQPELIETKESDTILGFVCQKYTTSIRSNAVEIWLTKETDFKASPILSVTPTNALVLKIKINGNYEIEAQKTESTDAKAKFEAYTKIIESAQPVDKANFKRLQIENRYTIIPVFENEIVNFGDNPINPEEEIFDHTYRYANGTIILKKIKLPEISDGGYVFANLTSRSNGDAYDRTGSLFIVPIDQEKSMLDAMKNGLDSIPFFVANNGDEYQGTVRTEGFSPALELMRFFSTFGVGHFNDGSQIAGYNWADSVVYKQDITELISSDDREIWIGVFIGNYDKGGHIVNLNLNYYPSFGESAFPKKWKMPLFNTVNILEMASQNYGTMFEGDSLEVEFELPGNIENLQLRFTTTGHGGWGNGDEFNQKVNEIFVDDTLVFQHIPWRCDCATYRTNNPSSGNFGNGLSSSDLSRSNWCPGTVTPPFFISLAGLKPGKHILKVAIPIGEREGGSFSAWCVSGTLIGNIADKQE